MPVKQDGTLYTKTLKDRLVPEKSRVDAPDAPTGRFIGLGDLKGYDTRCRILEVVDKSGHGVNDAIDAGEVTIVIQPLTSDEDGRELASHDQLRVGRDEGYFIEIVGVVPPGLPTSEHTAGARGYTHQTQEYMADVPKADQSGIRPGRGALQDLAGAGEHGDPVPSEDKDRRAAEARHSRIFAEELAKTPDEPGRALAAANEQTGLDIRTLEPNEFPGPDAGQQGEQGDEGDGDQEPKRQDV